MFPHQCLEHLVIRGKLVSIGLISRGLIRLVPITLSSSITALVYLATTIVSSVSPSAA